MINKYITATILAVVSTAPVGAQAVKPTPRLVVNITIDQLRGDYLESFMPYYGVQGFKRLLNESVVYENTLYSFSPVDCASAIASIFTGTTPRYNGITGTHWLDKSAMIPVDCVDDNNCEGLFTKDKASPRNLTATTVGDELKMQTDGQAIVYSIAKDKEAAILSGGHAADGVFWVDRANKCWCSSKFYLKKVPGWMDSYNIMNVTDPSKGNVNSEVTKLALHCVSSAGMGVDAVPDMLNVTYDAKPPTVKGGNSKGHLLLQDTYIQLDGEIERLVSKIESKVGRGNVLFVITGTGYCDDKEPDYEKFRIETGTFYINRTANLLNMYLGAVYGSDKYVERCYNNEIFLNIKQIELKRISIEDMLSRSQAFLIQNAGVANALTRMDMLLPNGNSDSKKRGWYNLKRCGDLIVEVTPGWKLLNEDNKQQYISRESAVAFPIIIYGCGVAPKRISAPAAVDRIAPTVARAIRIRAPNACSAIPLY